ncbi:electron transfer flavoprotein beta subunit [Brevibacterium sanguinis]|uniref:Electron transfer flavoprotein beta subunit n=2 Tax=Brevibacterium TaxID=1696 RepID=A0A366IGF0_9MICO|nr:MULTISPECIES: electron transfer flavoprotein subunit beta/FixA family protein [Brevibacterium]RBP62241.1 electron transfer flavoprotein beta subunit [Brevibacterium sanguinis]RBP70627.1 electron transfer flavoprotein beta subunit [Brevibacterium celere]
MDILVCIKRVPDISGQVSLDASGTDIDHGALGHTISAHEECAVELAVQLADATDGEVTVLTLGTDDAIEQLRASLAVGANDAVLIEAEDPGAHGPEDIAFAIAEVVRSRASEGRGYDLVLVGNDAADTGDFQVGIRLAYELDRPVLTGITLLRLAEEAAEVDSSSDGSPTSIAAHGIGPAGTEVFRLPLPAVVAVAEGGVEPRYPSIPGRMKAKKAPLDEIDAPEPVHGNPRVALELPPEQSSTVTILGEGPGAAPALVDVLEEIGVLR